MTRENLCLALTWHQFELQKPQTAIYANITQIGRVRVYCRWFWVVLAGFVAGCSGFWVVLWFLYVSVGFCWARIGTILGSSWAILGSSWAILGHFRICVGLCFGLGHFSVVDFSSMQACAKNTKNTRKKYTKNTRKKYNLWTTLLMVFAAIFWLFLFLSWGMLQLGYVCLISGLCWALWAMLGHSGPR